MKPVFAVSSKRFSGKAQIGHRLCIDRSKRGFTLIELLVTISIIAVLVALLQPAINAARDKAMESTCLGNMRGLGALISTYAAETGVFPSSSRAMEWDVQMMTAGYLPNLKVSRQGCPKNNSKMAATFGYNFMQLGNEDELVPVSERNSPRWGTRRPVEVQKPSETIMLTDGHDLKVLPDPANPAAGWPCAVYWDSAFWPVPKSGGRGERAPLGHNGRVNVIWVDGHGSSMKAADAWGLPNGIQDSESFSCFARVKDPSSL